MRKLPSLKTQRAILRLPTLEDIPAILLYFKENESHLAPFDPKNPANFYTEDFWKEKIPKHTEAFLADQALRLFIFLPNTNEMMGSLEFSQISRGPFQACYLGYGIAKKYQGQGIMHESLLAAIQYAFGELNIHRIMANHLPENERSAQLLQRLGFQRECVAKEYLRVNGAWRDHVLNSLHNSNWRDLDERMDLSAYHERKNEEELSLTAVLKNLKK